MLPSSVLLILSGGIAVCKSLELIRRLKENAVDVTCILTEAAAQFVTPLCVGALSGNRVYQDLFCLNDEAEMGHIQLSRQADLVVAAPATANLIARHAQGLADDLATTVLLATTAPVLMAPAMNVQMWQHPATQRNVKLLKERGIVMVGPEEGRMACGEFGPGRMAEPDHLCERILTHLHSHGRDYQSTEQAPPSLAGQPLASLRALVTAGPTHEALDPVRYIANRSSGKQGYAIATALQALGAETTVVCGPNSQATPEGVKVLYVETAREMLAACQEVMAAAPLDIAVCAAAVSDWRAESPHREKRKKKPSETGWTVKLVKNPDILAEISKPGKARPGLVVGFAAETENHLNNARQKRTAKGCDWILLNDVSTGSGTFGGDDNQVHILKGQEAVLWATASKEAIGRRLAEEIAQHFHKNRPNHEKSP